MPHCGRRSLPRPGPYGGLQPVLHVDAPLEGPPLAPTSRTPALAPSRTARGVRVGGADRASYSPGSCRRWQWLHRPSAVCAIPAWDAGNVRLPNAGGARRAGFRSDTTRSAFGVSRGRRCGRRWGTAYRPRSRAGTSAHQVPRPLGAAVVHELHRLRPALMFEHDDRVVTVPTQFPSHGRPDPLLRALNDLPCRVPPR
jgi:hypothetical protein